jgi:hypothetical protein
VPIRRWLSARSHPIPFVTPMYSQIGPSAAISSRYFPTRAVFHDDAALSPRRMLPSFVFSVNAGEPRKGCRRVPMLARARLKRKSNQITETSRGHASCDGKIWSPVHGFGEDDEAELTCEPSGYGLLEKHPYVTACTRSRSLEACRKMLISVHV